MQHNLNFTHAISLNGQRGLTREKRSYKSVNRTVKPFSEQKSGQKAGTINKFNAALTTLSSGSPKEKLLEDYFLHNKTGKLIFKNIIGNYYQEKNEKLVKNVGELYKNTKPQDRKTVLSTIAPVYSQRELLDQFGLSVSTNSYRNAKKIARTGVGRYIKKVNNTNSISSDTIECIRTFC